MAAAACGCACWLFSACDPGRPPKRQGGVADPKTLASGLAEARLRLAAIALERSSPDEALALLVAALEADPSSRQALEMAHRILCETRWNLAVTTLAHPGAIERLHFPNPSSLWVGLAGTLTRWDLEALESQATLFPVDLPDKKFRSLVADVNSQYLVIERAGFALLCDAMTLKPIQDIGVLPENVTPSAVVTFSPDGLLLAHPELSGDGSLVWHLRDSKTGGIIRSSEPAAAGVPAPLAAWLDRKQLRVLHADGSLMEMPVSPTEEIRMTPYQEGIRLSHAMFARNGDAALVLRDHGPHQPAGRETLELGAAADSSLEPASLLQAHPWSRHPTIWSGLFKDPNHALLWVEDKRVDILTDGHAPIHADSPVTALAIRGDRIAVGEENGTVTLRVVLPAPSVLTENAEPVAGDPPVLARLVEFLAGMRCAGDGVSCGTLTTGERLRAAKECDFTALRRMFPDLDFAPVAAAVEKTTPETADPQALASFGERLARARNAPEPDPAAKLQQALVSDQAEAIETCLKESGHLPPLLKKLAVSRIAWLQDRKADAMALWPDGFPDLREVRLREDWDGWEHVDFHQAMEILKAGVNEELEALTVPNNATAGQREEVFKRLTDAHTLRIVGRARLASACLEAARAFAASSEETEKTLQLASLARNLGEDPARCLRAEATAYTALGDYENAHQRWLMLITDYAVAFHEPGDYAEAAYTAFENADPHQAMVILTTGLHRFPNDANFALRAGWVALLTGNAERAYRFLLTGRQIGYPQEKIENATALLAIAASQAGAVEDAEVFYQELIALDPAWQNPETIDSLEWPEDLKSSLRQSATGPHP